MYQKGHGKASGLEVRFNLSKIEAKDSCYICWKIFWSCFDHAIFEDLLCPAHDFLAGICPDELKVFSILVEVLPLNNNDRYIKALKQKLEEDHEFVSISATPMFFTYGTPQLLVMHSSYRKVLGIRNSIIEMENDEFTPCAMKALNDTRYGTLKPFPQKL